MGAIQVAVLKWQYERGLKNRQQMQSLEKNKIEKKPLIFLICIKLF
jgi:hypothetical protein